MECFATDRGTHEAGQPQTLGLQSIKQIILHLRNSPCQRHQEEEETNKTKQAQIEQTYEKHYD